jgi:hypothetical protein
MSEPSIEAKTTRVVGQIGFILICMLGAAMLLALVLALMA